MGSVFRRTDFKKRYYTYVVLYYNTVYTRDILLSIFTSTLVYTRHPASDIPSNPCSIHDDQFGPESFPVRRSIREHRIATPTFCLPLDRTPVAILLRQRQYRVVSDRLNPDFVSTLYRLFLLRTP